MAFIIKEYPTNHYLVCTEVFDACIHDKFYKIGKKINGWWPDLSRAVRFETIEKALEIFNEIMKDVRTSFSYKIIDTEYEF